MKTIRLVIFSLVLMPSMAFSQTYGGLEAGYGHNGMFVSGELSHEFNRVAVAAQYGEYNVIGPDIRQVGAALGYIIGNDLKLTPYSGATYQWYNKESKPRFVSSSGAKLSYDLGNVGRLFVEYHNDGVNNYGLGLMVRIIKSGPGPHRFF